MSNERPSATGPATAALSTTRPVVNGRESDSSPDLGQPWAEQLRRLVWGPLLYLALAFPLGIAYFVALVAGLSAAGALVIIWVGVPLLGLMLLLIRAAGRGERWMLENLLGASVESEVNGVVGEGSVWNRVRTLALDPLTYRTVVWLFLRFPLGVLSFVILVAMSTATVDGAAEAIPGVDSTNLMDWEAIDGRWGSILIGIAALLLFLPVVHLLAGVHRTLGAALLGTSARERLRALERKIREADATADVASELHDSLGHTISVMTMQAGAARLSLDRSTDQREAAAALAAVEHSGRAAMSELDRLLGLMAADDPPAGGAVASFEGLTKLVDELTAAGLPVALTLDPSAEVPAPHQAAAYQVVRESLTNVMRHAPAATSVEVAIKVENEPAELLVSVTDNGRSDGTKVSTPPVPGRGIGAMQKRCELFGGSLEAALTNGGFRVEARLPIG